MSEKEEAIYETKEHLNKWAIFDNSPPEKAIIVLEELSHHTANQCAILLNQAYQNGFNDARTLYDEKLFD